MISYRTSKGLFDCHRAYTLTSGLDLYYPDFSDWFWNKVVPSVMTGESEIVLAEDKDEVIGISLLKRGEEPKLRCLRVLPNYTNRGVGIHLIDKSLKLLDHDKPMVTVPEEKINELSRIMVNRFSFDLKHVNKGLYRPGKLEYQFNGDSDQGVKSPY